MEQGERRDSTRCKEGIKRVAKNDVDKIGERWKQLAAAAGGTATETVVTSRKDSVGIDNVAVAFGLREDKEDDNSSLGGGSSYAYESSASKHYSVGTVGSGSAPDGGCGGSAGVCGGNVEDQHHLKLASSVIVNPIFGDRSRAVGRQPQRKTPAADAAASRDRDGSMASESRREMREDSSGKGRADRPASVGRRKQRGTTSGKLQQ